MKEQSYTRNMKSKYFGIPPRFNPDEGITVREPPGKGYGYWAGGHNAAYDPEEKKFYLFYRLRAPLEKGRGGVCRIAESKDGVVFSDIWEATKEDLCAKSIEVGSLIRDPVSEKWRLYISYEYTNGPWRIDLIEADSPTRFSVQHRRTVVQPGEYGLSFVKDPKVYIVGGMYYLFVNANPKAQFVEDANGVRRPLGGCATGLMPSPDGRYFRSFSYIFEPERGASGDWGFFRARINSIVYIPPLYVGFIDGGLTMYDNYEEQCGLAVSHDLEHWRRVTTDGPWLTGKNGSPRYIDALIVDDEIWYYYEYPRPDGSHELKISKVSL